MSRKRFRQWSHTGTLHFPVHNARPCCETLKTERFMNVQNTLGQGGNKSCCRNILQFRFRHRFLVSCCLTSAPNHSCPARLSWRTSSGNFTRKSRLALCSEITSSMIFSTIVRTWNNQENKQLKETKFPRHRIAQQRKHRMFFGQTGGCPSVASSQSPAWSKYFWSICQENQRFHPQQPQQELSNRNKEGSTKYKRLQLEFFSHVDYGSRLQQTLHFAEIRSVLASVLTLIATAFVSLCHDPRNNTTKTCCHLGCQKDCLRMFGFFEKFCHCCLCRHEA